MNWTLFGLICGGIVIIICFIIVGHCICCRGKGSHIDSVDYGQSPSKQIEIPVDDNNQGIPVYAPHDTEQIIETVIEDRNETDNYSSF